MALGKLVVEVDGQICQNELLGDLTLLILIFQDGFLVQQGLKYGGDGCLDLFFRLNFCSSTVAWVFWRFYRVPLNSHLLQEVQ